MLLSEVLEAVEVLDHVGPLDVPITGVTHDSRAAGQGSLFCCIPGATADGHDYAQNAVANGAVALLCERNLATQPAVPVAVVENVRRAMAPVSAAFWGWPARSMRTAGVTGTAGKTTTVAFLAAIFEAHGWPCASIGTLSGERTTPESSELQAALAQHVENGSRALAMEVSSHALVQHRVDALQFDVAVFTNLGRDHLDFHVDQASYFEAKAQLFTPDRAQAAVICVEDAWGEELAARVEKQGAVPVTRVSLADAADLRFEGSRGSRYGWNGVSIDLRVPGRHNVINALLAANAASALGVDPQAIARGIAAVGSVPGRFERVERSQPFATVVDFAHTPDSLVAALDAARLLAAADGGRVILVVGCGGDRDRGKRPVIAAVAEELADVAFFTSDNPRSENPLDILAEMVGGLRDKASVHIEEDRAQAISLAIDGAQPGDVVLIAGKGHETTQTFADRTEHFDDREVATAALHARGYGA
ncbi:MAG TPA: UDP-N-acetylmuramoyl-L-alanyl-D-glutamate--2,6-diaminopimelate ligase [Acidimicrobiales bacterium]|nr:UDP-N-acetylmuramoyl-L-alanyl-D-glutamate--2,6-diaminopimelate ligase [Acidimicrobiales bacterium]